MNIKDENDIFVVDIDGTITKESISYWPVNFEVCVPDLDIIDKLNALYAKGCIIIYYTSRFAEDKKVTIKWLKKHGVKYHKVVFDKPRGTFYLDSKNILIKDLV